MPSKGTQLRAESQGKGLWTGKRNLPASSAANVDNTQSEPAEQEFVKPQGKKRRFGNKETKGKHGKLSNHRKPYSLETRSTSRMAPESPLPDVSALYNAIEGSPAMAQAFSPAPDMPPSPATWDILLKSPPENQEEAEAEPTKMTPSPRLTTSNKLDQKDISVAQGIGKASSEPETVQMLGSSLPNEEMQWTDAAQPLTVSGNNVGQTNPSEKGTSQTATPAEHVPGTLVQDTESPTISQGLPRSQPNEEDATEQDPSSQTTSQAASLPKPAATREELLRIFKNLDEDTLRSMARQCEAKNLGSTVTNIMQHMMEKNLANQVSWTGKSSKKNCQKLKFENTPKHKYMKKILEKTAFANKEESDVKKAVMRSLHNVPDWKNGRVSRRQEHDADPGEGPSSSLNVEEVNGLGPNHCDNVVVHGRVDMLMKRMKFEAAISLLEDHPTTVMQQMKLFECNFQLEREEKVMEVIENMRTLIVQSPQYKANDLFDLGLDNYLESSHIKAISCFICAAKLYPLVSDPNEVVTGICQCSICTFAIFEITGQNRLMRDFAWRVGLKIANDMLNDITVVTNADPDVKVQMTASCLKNIGVCYWRLKNYDKAKEIYQRGIDIMTEQFGSDSSKYCVYGDLLVFMAWVNDDLGNRSEAKKMLERAKNVLERAEDFQNDELKNKWINFVDGAIFISSVLEELTDLIDHVI